jgi:hypothetical protein
MRGRGSQTPLPLALRRVMEESFTSQNFGPNTVLTYEGPNPKTLDELLEAMEVDLNIYQVEKWIANKWDGQLKGGKPVPLFQVKVWLVPYKLEPPELCVPQVILDVPNVPVKKGRKAKVRRALFLTDLHVGYRRNIDTGVLEPYHDREALDVVHQLASRFPFDEIIFGGDQLDLPEWTRKFNKGPEFYFTTKPSIIELGWWLSRFMHTAPDAPIRVLEGNHEKRLPKLVNDSLIAAHSLPSGQEVIRKAFDLGYMLGLVGDHSTWHAGYPNNAYWLNGSIKVVHGNKTSAIPGALPFKLLEGVDYSVVYGHNHKMETVQKTIEFDGGLKVLTAGSPGCLCRLDYKVPGHTYGQQWQQGVAIIHFTATDLVRLELVPIHKGRLYYDGYEFSSTEVIHELASDFVLEAMNSG